MATRLLRIVTLLAVTLAVVVALVAASASLSWRYVHDSPLMIYAGYLVAGGAVPYRDFFDMNVPGTYFAMAAVGRIAGWGDLGFRVFDLLCLASIALATFVWLRRFGRLSALAAAVAFPLWYLHGGLDHGLTLQREFLALVPFSAMLVVATREPLFTGGRQAILAGFLAGLTMLIKPQFLLLSLPLLVLLPGNRPARDRRGRWIAIYLAGLSIPLGAMFLYLLGTGGLGPFLDMAIHYWPLYTHLSGGHVPIDGLYRVRYLVTSTGAGLWTVYVPMAVAGFIVLAGNQPQRRRAWMLAGLLVATALYPAVSGQFWSYHWIPFHYVALCLASLPASAAWSERPGPARMVSILSVTLLLFTLSLSTADQLRQSWKGNGGAAAPKAGVPDEIARFLRSHMKPGDRVQPLDWTGGAVHGMLMARAPLATRFLYDFHFYHHVDRPYIASLRRAFMAELVDERPRFIIQVLENKPWPAGDNTTREFPELKRFLDQNYAPAQQGAAYRILQRVDPAPPRG